MPAQGALHHDVMSRHKTRSILKLAGLAVLAGLTLGVGGLEMLWAQGGAESIPSGSGSPAGSGAQPVSPLEGSAAPDSSGAVRLDEAKPAREGGVSPSSGTASPLTAPPVRSDDSTRTPVSPERSAPKPGTSASQAGSTPPPPAKAAALGPRVEWTYQGLVLEPVFPPIASLVVAPSSTQLAVGLAAVGAQDARTQIYDLSTRRRVDELTGLAPFSLVDGRGNLAALLMKGEQAQVMIKQDGSGGFGFRFLKIPLPQGAIATFPYQLKPAHFAMDGTLLLPGIGRDRLYRINPALGTSTALLPETPVDILDFDVTPEGEILLLDGFDQQLVWMNLEGTVLATVPLLKRDKGTPEHLFFSVAAAGGRTAWVGVAIKQPSGIFAPELQRVTGRLKQRLTLDRTAGTAGYPLLLSGDGSGGVVLADELNMVMQVDASVQPGKPWQVLGAPAPSPAPGETSQGEQPRPRIYVTEGGRRLEGLDQALGNALPELNLCYEKLRQVSRKARGTYKITLTTQDRGIERVDVAERDFDDFGLESCVSTALKRVKFGSRVGQHSLKVALHFLPPDRG